MSSALTRREILGCLAASCGAPALAQPAFRPPNFVILFADDMGYGDLGCYGHPNIRTPNLDRMAAEGVRFTSFYAAAPVCTPSRAGLLTGRYAVRAGLPNNLGPESKGGLPLSEITLAQVLKSREYKTMAIGKWHVGHNPVDYLPTRRGFDSYFGLLYSNDMIPPWVKTNHPLDLYRGTEPAERVTDQSTLAPRYTAEAVKFIRSAGDSPFFLYLPYAMPHLPVSAPADTRGRSRAGLYGDTIETLDWSAGEILGVIREQGIDDRTMVVFASDNGPWNYLPSRMLQNGVEPWHTGSPGLLRGSKGTTYEGGQRVPGIVRWPGVIPAGQVQSGMASTLDLFPTLTRAAGAFLPRDRVYDGIDLLPAMKSRTEPGRKDFFYFRGTALEAIRSGSWKYRVARNAPEDGRPADPGAAELFDLDLDPAEHYNVFERHRDIAEKLSQRMKEFAVEVGARIQQP